MSCDIMKEYIVANERCMHTYGPECHLQEVPCFQDMARGVMIALKRCGRSSFQ